MFGNQPYTQQKYNSQRYQSRKHFLNKKGDIKVGDFGISRILEEPFEKVQSQIGTTIIQSPQIINKEPYTTMTDIWSLGVLLYRLCALKYPFEGDQQYQVLQSIAKCSYQPIPNKYSDSMKQLIESMLQIDETKRLTAQQILDQIKNLPNQNLGFPSIKPKISHAPQLRLIPPLQSNQQVIKNSNNNNCNQNKLQQQQKQQLIQQQVQNPFRKKNQKIQLAPLPPQGGAYLTSQQKKDVMQIPQTNDKEIQLSYLTYEKNKKNIKQNLEKSKSYNRATISLIASNKNLKLIVSEASFTSQERIGHLQKIIQRH